MKWIVLSVLLLSANAANILLLLPTPSFSHHQFYHAFVQELLKRGHNLTHVTPSPLKDSNLANLREVDLSYGYKYMKAALNMSSGSLKLWQLPPEIFLPMFEKIVTELCHQYLSDPNLMDIYHQNEKFDLAIFEWGVFDCLYPFEKLANGKMIGISSFETGSVALSNLGCPTNPAFIPDISLEYSDKMSFLQRLRSTMYFGVVFAFMKYLRWKETIIARKYFGDELPSLTNVEKKVALVFDNSHVTMSYPKPFLPNLIPLGGPPFHMTGRKLKGLPKDVKEFMDGAEEGVVYFSLGTNVKTSNFSSKEEEALIRAFRKMKQRVLWKWDNTRLNLNLKNVMMNKWFPQIEVLAHPRMKAFVTQGGLQSIGEAIEFKVPMIVMPFFADQGHNARKLESVGAAIVLKFDDITEIKFEEALNDIVHNSTYKENIIKFSKLVRDQPMPPLERAIWWTEYVIRHNGAPHLRSIAATMPWYQYLNLDVFLVVLLIFLLLLYCIYRITTVVFWLLFGKKIKKD